MAAENKKICPECNGEKKIAGTCVCDMEWRGSQKDDEWLDYLQYWRELNRSYGQTYSWEDFYSEEGMRVTIGESAKRTRLNQAYIASSQMADASG